MVGFAGYPSKRSEHLIRIQKVTKEYSCGPSVVKALRQANLTLDVGEFVLLQGMSGSGKTTLLSIMGCLMKPTSGRVVICGKDVTEMGESQLPPLRLKHIGFIFQSFNLFPSLTAKQNVSLALQLKGFGWRQRSRESSRLLERVGLSKEADRKPGDMSGGQRQRVCIARALAGDSDIILADEPTAALDTATGLEIMELLKEQTRSGNKAVLVVTHDPRLERYATRVDRITDGILTVGAPVRARGTAAGEIEKPVITAAHNTPIGLASIGIAH